MRDFLLDTQTISYWYDPGRAEHAAVVANISRLRELSVALETKPRMLVSMVSLGEIEFGNRVQPGDRSEHREARARFVREQLPAKLDVTRDAVDAYGELRARLFEKLAPGHLRKKGMRPEQLVDPTTALALQIQENDLWLCAQAIGHEMVLVTNDRMLAIRKAAEGMVPELIVQDWSKPGSAVVPV